MDNYIIILQDWIMQFGIYEVTGCVLAIVAIWRLPEIIRAVNEYKKGIEDD